MKNIIFLLFAFNLYALITIPIESRQLLLVSADGFTNNQAILRVYERTDGVWKEHFYPIPVNLGRNGLAWGEGMIDFEHAHDEPIKYEGDGKSPAGLFQLESAFGYEDEKIDYPYLQVDASTLCIDDTASDQYNKIIHTKNSESFRSFEYMKRQDDLYRLGVVVGHNQKRLHKRGSCIFLHIQKNKGAPTSGCTSMHEDRLYQILQWLDADKKPLLLQLPAFYLRDGFK